MEETKFKFICDSCKEKKMQQIDRVEFYRKRLIEEGEILREQYNICDYSYKDISECRCPDCSSSGIDGRHI